MPYFMDLAPWTYRGTEAAKKLVAIGWIDRAHPFEQNTMPEDVLAKLEQFPTPRASLSFLGIHECSFCSFSRTLTGYVVPSNGFLYVYSALLIHSIREHGYRPPEAFCEAVRNAPPFDSTEYLRLVKQHGPRGMFNHLKIADLEDVY